MNKQEAAEYDHELNVRAAGVNDHLASEGKYHPNGYKHFLRKLIKN